MLGLTIHPLFGAARRPSAALQARARCAARAQSNEPAEEIDLPNAGGWLDSSFDLQAGLTVVEHTHLHGDTLELAVALWLH